jgi:hypothetical protein
MRIPNYMMYVQVSQANFNPRYSAVEKTVGKLIGQNYFSNPIESLLWKITGLTIGVLLMTKKN